MKLLKLIFLTLIIFSKHSFAIFGVFDKDFCQNNPGDLLCTTGADEVIKSTMNSSENNLASDSRSFINGIGDFVSDVVDSVKKPIENVQQNFKGFSADDINWDAVGRLGEQLQYMDMQRMNSYNSVAPSNNYSRSNIYSNSGQYLGYSENYGNSLKSNIYNPTGQYLGYEQGFNGTNRTNVYDTRGQYRGFFQ